LVFHIFAYYFAYFAYYTYWFITHIGFSSLHITAFSAYSTYSLHYSHIEHILYIVHILHILYMYFPGFELSDNEEVPEDMHQDQPAQDTPEMAMKVQIPLKSISAASSCDASSSIRFSPKHLQFGSNTAIMFKALEPMDAHLPPGPVLVLSKHARGGVR
jgi:hypothetical protein